MNTEREIIGCVQHDCEHCKAQAATIAGLQQQLTEANRRGEELEALLKVAKCPNDGCDNNGTIAHQVAYNEWEPEQCEWCYEKATATSKRGGE